MKKVVIIDDDPYVRNFYEKLFRNQEYEVILAKSGEQGIELVVSQQPSLILLDILMAPMNGLQVLDKLKSRDDTKNIPVIMLTNIDDNKIIQEAQQHGAYSFMVKTYFEPEELRSQISKILGE